jgi:hypothetical protein
MADDECPWCGDRGCISHCTVCGATARWTRPDFDAIDPAPVRCQEHAA